MLRNRLCLKIAPRERGVEHATHASHVELFMAALRRRRTRLRVLRGVVVVCGGRLAGHGFDDVPQRNGDVVAFSRFVHA
jgi:hypothetical protein